MLRSKTLPRWVWLWNRSSAKGEEPAEPLGVPVQLPGCSEPPDEQGGFQGTISLFDQGSAAGESPGGTWPGETLPLQTWLVPEAVTQRGDTGALSGLLAVPRWVRSLDFS